jgi:hypothetical protein
MPKNNTDLDILIDSIFEAASDKEAYERALILLNQFEAKLYAVGQQSERDKHRWIPVTERLPTEKDIRENSSNKTRIKVLCKDNNMKAEFMGLYNFACHSSVIRPESDEDNYVATHWQTLPEA